jgi:hypothetical protein
VAKNLSFSVQYITIFLGSACGTTSFHLGDLFPPEVPVPFFLFPVFSSLYTIATGHLVVWGQVSSFLSPGSITGMACDNGLIMCGFTDGSATVYDVSNGKQLSVILSSWWQWLARILRWQRHGVLFRQLLFYIPWSMFGRKIFRHISELVINIYCFFNNLMLYSLLQMLPWVLCKLLCVKTLKLCTFQWTTGRHHLKRLSLLKMYERVNWH